MQIRIKTENVIQKQIIFFNTKLSFFVNLTPKKWEEWRMENQTKNHRGK